MNCLFDPGFGLQAVGRFHPDRASTFVDHLGGVHKGTLAYTEVPYDYGEEIRVLRGGIPVKDQPGAKFFQDGFGVDMRGNVAEQCNIYYVPRMEDEGRTLMDAGHAAREQRGIGDGGSRYAGFRRYVEEAEKRGEEMYAIRRVPGIPLAGGTIWTFASSGELRQECAVIAAGCILGAQMDEDGYLYFATSHGKMINGKVFLSGRGGNLGTDDPLDKVNLTPLTYTYIKARPKDVQWLLPHAPVPLDVPPARPTDLVSWGPFGYQGSPAWVEGAEWMYAGYSPGVPAGCTCPATRAHLDWFKRSYLPEAYRYSIAILDTNGNLIMHLGRYGNLDDVLRAKKGSEDIPLTLPRFICGTDNYLAFDDWGERLVVLKLNYHTEATAGIQ